jgi:hypothetical protein
LQFRTDASAPIHRRRSLAKLEERLRYELMPDEERQELRDEIKRLRG